MFPVPYILTVVYVQSWLTQTYTEKYVPKYVHPLLPPAILGNVKYVTAVFIYV
jgi:hypothetical protein